MVQAAIGVIAAVEILETKVSEADTHLHESLSQE